MSSIATHKSPAWGPRSNFIIRADLGNHGLPGAFEQLWARKIDSTHFEICCIPFFTYGLSLGDKVESNDQYTIQKITEKSGHKTLRVAVASQEKQDKLHEVLHHWVEQMGFTYEWYSTGYLAVDLPPETRDVDIFQISEQLNAIVDVSVEIDE